MLFQKTYTDEAFRVVRNYGVLDQYYLKGHHQGIISREIFEKTAAALNIRKNIFGKNDEKGIQNHSSLTGKLVCASCGSPMYRQMSGSYPTYRCYGRTKRTADCRMKGEMEESVMNAFLTCMNKLAYSQSLSARFRILDQYTQRLRERAERDETIRLLDSTIELRKFLSTWTSAGNSIEQADRAFKRFVDRAIVNTGVRVTFRFNCGLEFAESLRRPA